jgi:hypothetical protein
VINPGIRVQLDALQIGEVAIDGRLIVSEEGRLPGDVGL